MEWLIERLTSILWTTHPYERIVLIFLMWFRVSLVAFLSVLMWTWLKKKTKTRLCFIILALLVVAFLSALVSADFVEHYLKKLTLSYTYNPRVMAIGEFECGMITPFKPLLPLWEAHKFNTLFYYMPDGTYKQAVWEGDPGSGKFGDE